MAVPLSTINGHGLHTNRPTASALLAGYRWLSTDLNGGTEFLCDGSTWVQCSLGVTETPSGGGSGGVQVSDPITVSSADLLALDTVRKEVLAAPGVGLVRLVLWAVYRVVPGSNAYAIDPGEGIAMRYGSGSATAGAFLDGEVPLGSAAPFLVTAAGNGYGAALSEFEDQPITLLATAPITAGNGHLVLTLGYQDVSVA